MSPVPQFVKLRLGKVKIPIVNKWFLIKNLKVIPHLLRGTGCT